MEVRVASRGQSRKKKKEKREKTAFCFRERRALIESLASEPSGSSAPAGQRGATESRAALIGQARLLETLARAYIAVHDVVAALQRPLNHMVSTVRHAGHTTPPSVRTHTQTHTRTLL